jgi:hypothetical protein
MDEKRSSVCCALCLGEKIMDFRDVFVFLLAASFGDESAAERSCFAFSYFMISHNDIRLKL